MAAFLTNIFFFFYILSVYKVLTMDTYIAAVYEHAVVLPDATETPVTPAEALKMMNRNIDILEKAIKTAAEQNASIIVTPEDGIYGWRFTRAALFPYLEDIPDPAVEWNPCTDPQRFGPAPVQERLSCLARINSIYVAANIGDKKPCKPGDTMCPADGHYQYNTNVVFDDEGKLVARYHKYSLFQGEVQFDTPKEPELMTFNTPFGKFGTFTCFDILFHDPAVALVVDLSVDTVLFPTAWMNVLPHLTAIEFHSAWAMGMGVNVLSANTHNTTNRMTGSGIYAPDYPRAYYYNADMEDGHLVLAEVLSHPRHSPSYSVVQWSEYATSISGYSTNSSEFVRPIFFDNFTLKALEKPEGNQTTCQKNLCCHLSYSMVEKREDEVYALGAFDGMHEVEGEYYLQICTLLKCKSTHLDTCGEPVETSSTLFQSFSLSGTFGTSFVFPEVLLTGIKLAPGDFEISPDGRLVSRSSISSTPLLSATLFGRWYDKDPPAKNNASTNNYRQTN
ncbi:pantetheinase-like [Pleurodeles waltl]|uniref:pantetheinase-like n=1 Tax=Pleurodeles waltl TaxID=8319 RepID=UPI003709B8FE